MVSSNSLHFSTFISTTTTTFHILRSPIIIAEVSNWPRFRFDSHQYNRSIIVSTSFLPWHSSQPYMYRFENLLDLWFPLIIGPRWPDSHSPTFLLTSNSCSPTNPLYQSTSLIWTLLIHYLGSPMFITFPYMSAFSLLCLTLFQYDSLWWSRLSAVSLCTGVCFRLPYNSCTFLILWYHVLFCPLLDQYVTTLSSSPKFTT